MIVLQLLLYCLLFTAMVKIAVIGGAVNGLYFYPKEVQDRAIELGLIDRNTMNRKRKCFMIPEFVDRRCDSAGRRGQCEIGYGYAAGNVHGRAVWRGGC